jgi:hypothetical protein
VQKTTQKVVPRARVQPHSLLSFHPPPLTPPSAALFSVLSISSGQLQQQQVSIWASFLLHLSDQLAGHFKPAISSIHAFIHFLLLNLLPRSRSLSLSLSLYCIVPAKKPRILTAAAAAYQYDRQAGGRRKPASRAVSRLSKNRLLLLLLYQRRRRSALTLDLTFSMPESVFFGKAQLMQLIYLISNEHIFL